MVVKSTKALSTKVLAEDTTSQMDYHERYLDISEYWELFIEKNENPRMMKPLRKEIAESWIRSKRRKIDPYQLKLSVLPPQEFEKIKESKSLLINTALPYIENMADLILSLHSGFTITLQDENGLVLYIGGDKDILEYNSNFNVIPGAIFSEEAAGTHGGGTCLILKKPIQISESEHYNFYLRYGTASAAPIFYPNGDLAGCISVATNFDVNQDKRHPHTLGLVAAIAWAIQNQLQLVIKNNKLKHMNGLLQTTFTVTDVGYITIDTEGKITHANYSAGRQLELSLDQIIGNHYQEIIGNEDLIKDVMENGCAVKDYETCIVTHQIKRNYLLSIQPILDEENNCINGVVVTMQPIEKINQLVTSRSGSEAQFTFSHIIGTSPKLRKVIAQAKTVAQLPSNVLLYGESGTGKELFAQSIHNESRPKGPFVAINCAALPRGLVESELYGYESGSFTGAEKKGRPGKIELAEGGTLFLDEIGDMPLGLQSTLLRVLETKKVMRIGGQRYVPVDFRLIAATNQDLAALVQEKKFREDLYYRLTVFTIPIPPLRERKDDIELLCKHFIAENSSKLHIKPPKLSEEVYKIFKEYPWPGNVRELENTITYVISMSQNQCIGKDELPEKFFRPIASEKAAFGVNAENELYSITDAERICILRAMQHTHNNTEEAAKILGIARTTLYRKLKEYNLTM